MQFEDNIPIEEVGAILCLDYKHGRIHGGMTVFQQNSRSKEREFLLFI